MCVLYACANVLMHAAVYSLQMCRALVHLTCIRVGARQRGMCSNAVYPGLSVFSVHDFLSLSARHVAMVVSQLASLPIPGTVLLPVKAAGIWMHYL